MFHGDTVDRGVAVLSAEDRPARSWRAVQAQGLPVPSGLLHAAETTVPPGQMRPTSHWVSAKVHPGGALQVAIEPQFAVVQHLLSAFRVLPTYRSGNPDAMLPQLNVPPALGPLVLRLFPRKHCGSPSRSRSSSLSQFTKSRRSVPRQMERT